MIEQTVCFDGHDLSQLVLVTGVTRQIIPARRITQTQVPGMDGELLSSVELDSMEVVVSCVIRGRLMEEVTEARRVLASCLSSRVPARLVLPDEPYTYLMAVYEGGAEPSDLARNPEVELTFLCPDPVAYGARRTAEAPGRLKVGGNHRTWPVVTCRPPAGSSWQVTNVGTGEFVRVLAEFDGSQTVSVDMGLQTCKVNGSYHAVDIASDYFAIEGDAELSVSGGTAQVEWEERWV